MDKKDYKVVVVGIEEGHFSIVVANEEKDFLKTTVRELKERIHARRGEIETDCMRLLFAGKQLENMKANGKDEYTLEDYNIQNNSTIQTVIRVHGGTDRVPVPSSVSGKVHDIATIGLNSIGLKFSSIEPDAILGSSDEGDTPRVQM